jgi:hypothetical protein
MGPILGGLFGACIYDAFLYVGEDNIFKAKQFVYCFLFFFEEPDFGIPSCLKILLQIQGSPTPKEINQKYANKIDPESGPLLSELV